MNHLVLAPCSRRKRLPPEPGLRAADLEPGPLLELATAWAQRVRGAASRVPAGELYIGRGLVEARRAATAVGADLRIVSAGLGLVDARAAVPAYSLTVAGGDPDSIAYKVESGFAPGDWWRALQRALNMPEGALADLLSSRRGLAILGLPSTYLELITDELRAMPMEVLSRVRIIGPPRASVRAELAHVWMPYDARFDGEGSPNPGTRGDFAQRAARHFAEEVVCRAPEATPADHAEMVERCLEPLAPSGHPRRVAGSDAELIAVIRELLPRSGGRSGETLRLLRRHAGRACEQGRFRRLFAAAIQGELVR